MNTRPTDPTQTPRSLALAALLALPLVARAQVVTPEWELPPLYGEGSPNFIVFGAGGAAVNGDQGAFAERSGFRDFVLGITDGYYYREFDAGQLEAELTALAGSYTGHFDLRYTQWDEWYFWTGVRQDREWYDASGGYIPGTGEWIVPDQDVRALDHGKLWAEFGTLTDAMPEVTVTLTHHYRKGEKDSTIWGQGAGAKIAPAYYDIDETRDSLEITIEDETESTRWGAGGRYEHAETDDTYNTFNSPGGPLPLPQSQNTDVASDSGSGYGFLSHKLGESTTTSIGANVMRLDAVLKGFRDINNGSAFNDLNGDSTLTLYAVDANLDHKWRPDLGSTLAIGVTGEENEADSRINNGLGGNANNSDYSRAVLRGAFDTRYTGIDRLAVYLTLSGEYGSGELAETGNNYDRRTDTDREGYTVATGARWDLLSNLALNAEYYHRWREDDYANTRFDGVAAAYPGFADYLATTTDDVNARLTWRAAQALTLVSRVDFQQITTEARFANSPLTQESDYRNVVLSQSASWAPRPGLYLQGLVNYNINTLETPANDLVLPGGTTVEESVNDYWNLNLNAFAALDERTDLQLSYDFYYADNLESGTTVPVLYGASFREHRVGLTLTRELAEGTRGILTYAWYDGQDDTSGGNNDYNAHAIFAGLRREF